MVRRKRNRRRILFPWEQKGGWLRRLGLYRARPFAVTALLVAGVVLIGERERRAAGVRQTRNALAALGRAVDRYQAEHPGKCPPAIEELANYGSSKQPHRDAWGEPLRLVCPDPSGAREYRLSSGGPDRIAGGLDRIE